MLLKKGKRMFVLSSSNDCPNSRLQYSVPNANFAHIKVIASKKKCTLPVRGWDTRYHVPWQPSAVTQFGIVTLRTFSVLVVQTSSRLSITECN